MGLGSDSVPVPVQLRGRKTFLGDSMQFFLEYFLRLDRKREGNYHLGPVFRGEDHDPSHLNQFYQVECELRGQMDEAIQVAEQYISKLSKDALQFHEEQIRAIAGQTTHVERLIKQLSNGEGKLPRIDLEEALKLPEMVSTPNSWEYVVKDDIGKGRRVTRRGETILIQKYGGAVWLTEPDRLSVPFYHAFLSNGDESKAMGADLLLGLGEVIGLGERHDSHELVRRALRLHHVPEDDYKWYADMRNPEKGGQALKTAGWGMGMERFMMWLLKHDDIRDIPIIPSLEDKAESYMPSDTESEGEDDDESLGTMTWRGVRLWNAPIPPESKTLEDFLTEYEARKEDWHKLMRQAIHILKREFKRGKLVANVTGRVKQSKSLRKRLYEKQPKRNYTKTETILGDQWDFVGLRVAIYFPNEQDKAVKMIRDAFEDLPELKRDGSSRQGAQVLPYHQRFGGYDLEHLWVKLSGEDQRGVGMYAKQMMEIQLRTVMMDSWATINHTVEYKAISGKPSVQEYRVLDTVKGLASTGEVLLVHLHEVHQSRLASNNLFIRDEAHLIEILVGFLPELRLKPNEEIEIDTDADSIKALFGLVKLVDITRCDRLRRTLEELEIEEMIKRPFDPSFSKFFRGRSAVSKWDIILYNMLGKLSEQVRDLVWAATIRRLAPLPRMPIRDGLIDACAVGHTVASSLSNILNSAAEFAADAEFHEEDIEACAMVWYGSLCCSFQNYLLTELATAFFRAFGGREISPLSFALQRALLSYRYGAAFGLQDPFDLQDPEDLSDLRERPSLLDRFVETRPRSWEHGLNRVQRRLLDASDQGPNYEVTTLRESFARMRLASLRIAVKYQCPHLAKFEAETYWSSDATWRHTTLQIDWRALLLEALIRATDPLRDHDEASVGIFHSLLNCIDLQESKGSAVSPFYESSPRAFLKYLQRRAVYHKKSELEEILTLRLQNMP